MTGEVKDSGPLETLRSSVRALLDDGSSVTSSIVPSLAERRSPLHSPNASMFRLLPAFLTDDLWDRLTPTASKPESLSSIYSCSSSSSSS